MTVYNQNNRELNIEVDGKTGKDEYGNNYVLISEILDGSYQELSKQFHIKLILLSPTLYSPLTPEDMLGRNTTVKIKKDDGSWRLFNGIISNFIFNGYYSYSESGEQVYNADLYEYSVVLSPKMLLMKNSLKSRIFHSKKPSAVIEQILDEWNIDYDDKLTYDSGNDVKSYYEIEQIIQYKESDLDFISRLMQKDGIYYYFWQGKEDDNAVHKLILRDSNPSSELNLVYDYKGDSSDVTSFYQGEAVGPNKVRIDNYDYRQADVTFFNYDDTSVNQGTDLGTYAGKMQVDQYDADFICTSDKANASKYRKKLKKLEAQRLRCANYEWKGITQNREVAPGTAFTMTGYPAGDVNGLVTRVEFTAKTTAFSVLNGSLSEESNSSFDACFYAQDSGKIFRPQLTVKEPRVFETVNAKVITVENIPSDSTSFNSDLGGNPVWVDSSTTRVKILMNWRNTKSGNSPDFSTMWLNARFGQMWADSASGSFELPRKGQEVLVTFVNGNLAQPAVVGSLYNSVVTPPIDAELSEGVYGTLMRTTAVASNDDGGYDASSSLENTMPLPMSAYALGQQKNQKGYSQISMFSMDNGQFSEAAFDDTVFMSKWFFPGATPPISDLTGLLDTLKSGSAGKNMFFEGINMYSNKDVLNQAAQSQIINAGANIQITAGNSITLQVGRSKIVLADQGINMANTFGAQDKYAGYVTAYMDVDPNPPSMPKWSLGSFGSVLALVPGCAAMQAPLSVLAGTYLAVTKSWWGSECGALIGNTFVKGLNTEVKAGFDLLGFFDFFSKIVDAIMMDLTNTIKSATDNKDGTVSSSGGKGGIYTTNVIHSGLWLILGLMLIWGIFCCVVAAITSITLLFTFRSSSVQLACDKVKINSQRIDLNAPLIRVSGHPLGAYLTLLDDLDDALAGTGMSAGVFFGNTADLMEMATITERRVTVLEEEGRTLRRSQMQLDESSTGVSSNDSDVVQDELAGQNAELAVSDEDGDILSEELGVVGSEQQVSATDAKVSDSSATAIRQNMKALDQETRALITAYAGLDVEV
ncbi:type VI secretion system tip protein TssI/VgrG [Lentisphaerota bacterium ZTH]|nr:type VI secretion system tip protein VgrG [Lentisphaerota bacterium]WET05343.1 type VI secretion system tip protein TssI/VgrG [Lentisphaerota bacterium ZTH]